MIYFSEKTKGFYFGEWLPEYKKNNTWPDDAIALTDDEIKIYHAKQPPLGKILGVMLGRPAWVDLPPPAHDELIAVVESERQRLLSHADTVTADWRVELVLGDISEEDKVSLSAWMAYKREVKAVKAGEAIVPGFIWPAIPA
ncbi:tail fiber assembly protein [Citrobacter portucalensis]|uniref:tail fiber assembly protein n=1 Tax=Citrobacter portucalensis TaxID=1639133 RepID=UPI00312CB424